MNVGKDNIHDIEPCRYLLFGIPHKMSENMNSKVFQYIILILCFISNRAPAQKNEIYNDNIKTLKVVAGENWLAMPVIKLQGDMPVHISFDDLTHEYNRYTYKVEHCDANWNVSQGLFPSDYIEGFNNNITIEDITESFNTNTLYTHYKFEIPNEKCRIKMSGNYKVTIYDDNNYDRTIATCYFMVVEPIMGVSLAITSNTDREINGRMQQVDMSVNYGTINVTDPTNQLKTYVLQNGRWNTMVKNPKPQYLSNTGLKWLHNPSLIFWAGNEYRKFEMIDVNHATMGIEKILWDGKMYQAYIWQDDIRSNYVYDEDANGAFYIRNSHNIDNDRISDYLNVHFTLKCPRANGDVYINGTWTNDQLTPQYKMEYNEAEQCYTTSLLLKQGYYSYQYILQLPNGTVTYMPSEGSYYQTENTYQAFVYYRGYGERTDRLVGYQEVKFK